MRESNSLFKDQQRLFDISQRIAEQNDQILALLLELNTQPQIPPRLRYDLREPAIANRPDQPEKHVDEEETRTALRVSRHRISTGEQLQADHQDIEYGLLDSVEFKPKRSYANCLKNDPLPNIKSTSSVVNETTAYTQDDALTQPPLIGGFLSSRLEELYIQSLDDFLDRKSTNPRSHAMSILRGADKSTERERDTQIRNPVSVYNWLRKNQPQVFLQDGDEKACKAAAGAAGSRKSKRESTAAANKAVKTTTTDGEGAEEDVEAPAALKGKRKRDDDGGYRPKGGHARPVKRRKDENSEKTGGSSSVNGKKSKRASMDTI